MSKEEWLEKNDKAKALTKEYTEKNKDKILQERRNAILDEKIGEKGYLKNKAVGCVFKSKDFGSLC